MKNDLLAKKGELIKKVLFKSLQLALLIAILCLPLLTFKALPTMAAEAIDTGIDDPVWTSIFGNPKSPVEIVGSVIKVLMGFLGLIAVILILVAGFKWMTAGGNEAKVSEAKTMLKNATIGLLIILSAYSITVFVISSINAAVYN